MQEINEHPYDEFLNFSSKVSQHKHLDYSKILQNLKITITSFPSIEDITELYRHNFISKLSPLKSAKKKWKFEETLVFVWTITNYILMHKRSADHLLHDDWVYLSKLFPGLTAERCKFRWKSTQKSILQTNQWTDVEDELLSNIIQFI